MRRPQSLFALILLAAAAVEAGPLGEAMKAVAGNDPSPLPQLEAAIQADPDNLRSHSEYRMAVIKAGEYDRAIGFYEKLVEKHPQSANSWLNFGFAYVDKIPAAGSITQVILANNALTQFSKSIELQHTWLALFTRGNSYLYWPKIFGRAPLGVTDLEEAVAISKKETAQKRVYARAYIALGDGYWKTDQPDKAKAIWQEGLKLFPGEPQLEARLARSGEELEAYINDQLDPNKRVDTNLAALYEEEPAK